MFMILTTLFACQGTPPSPTTVAPMSGGLTASALNQELTNPQAKVRVYNYWAHWCQPCIAELPMLKRYAAAHPEVDVVLVNLDIESVWTGKVQKFIQVVGLKDLRHIHLDEADAMSALETIPDWPNTIPVTQIVRRNGTKVHQFNAAISEKMLNEAVSQAQ